VKKGEIDAQNIIIYFFSACGRGTRHRHRRGRCEKDNSFLSGSDFATVQESVIRGERDIYYITAKAGQTLEVSISAVEQNAVFSVFQPGTVAEDKNGFTEINGKALPRGKQTMRRNGRGHCPCQANISSRLAALEATRHTG